MISRTLSLQAPQGGAQFLWSQICPGAKNRSNGTPQKQVMQLQGIFHVHPLRQLVERQSHNDRLSQIKTYGEQSLAGRSSWKMLLNVYGIACIIKYPCTWHLRHLNCKKFNNAQSMQISGWKSMEKHCNSEYLQTRTYWWWLQKSANMDNKGYPCTTWRVMMESNSLYCDTTCLLNFDQRFAVVRCF